MGNVIMLKTQIKPSLREIPITYLSRGEYQPRQEFPKENLEALANTIRQIGILEPLIVRQTIYDNRFEIIAGERRWRAAQIARLSTVPCLVKNYSDEEAAQIALIENMCREELNPLAEAKAIDRMIKEFNYIHEEVAAILGVDRTEITNLLRLLKLDPRLQKAISEGLLGKAHGRILAGIDLLEQYPLGQECIKKCWSTRTLEKAVRAYRAKKQSISPIKNKDIHVKCIERELSDKLGYPVKIVLKKAGTGDLSISFFNLEQLQAVIEKLGYKEE